MVQITSGPAVIPACHSTDYWLEKLAIVCRQTRIDKACLGIINKSSCVSVAYGYATPPQDSAVNIHPAFCIAKLFTATLISLFVLQRKLLFGDEIAALLPATSGSDVLQGITVSQLLSHTHGLGSINVEFAPTDARGFIDYENVIRLLQKNTRTFAAGKFYSYGATGYILLGLVIEHVAREPFGRVLHREILARISHTATACPEAVDILSSTAPICPSSGRGLSLSLHELLLFAGSFVRPATGTLRLPDNLLREILTTRTALPGWSPIISGSCYGWKNFGNNWYGQNGIDSQHLTYVRINPANNIIVCLVAGAETRNPGALPSLLFRTAYPALCFSTARQPAILTDAPTDHCDNVIGNYGDRFTNFHVTKKHGRLHVAIASTQASNKTFAHLCYLYPAEERIFFLAQPWRNINFLQLVTDNNNDRYLWDHTQLWRELI